MQLIDVKLTRTPGGKAALDAVVLSRFKRPVGTSTLRVTATPPTPSAYASPESSRSTLLEGDETEVMELLFCLADEAWRQGYRPKGLGATLSAVVGAYKLPDPEQGT